VALTFHGGTADAQRHEGCTGRNHTLDEPTMPGVNIVITKECKVNVGTYKFGDVHILAGGTLEFTDSVIDFWAANILIENGGSLVAGAPDNPIGQAGGRLTIHLWARTIRVNPTKQGQAFPVSATPRRRCGIPNVLWESNITARARRNRPPRPSRSPR
jgi:hypothetical protein